MTPRDLELATGENANNLLITALAQSPDLTIVSQFVPGEGTQPAIPTTEYGAGEVTQERTIRNADETPTCEAKIKLSSRWQRPRPLK